MFEEAQYFAPVVEDADGIRLEVNSGWRSRAHQQRLLDEAVARYGSLDAALEYVATPEASAHVTGDAVDIGPADAADWLGRHGSARVCANRCIWRAIACSRRSTPRRAWRNWRVSAA